MSTGKLDLKSMTVDELWSLHEEVSAILSARILEEKRELEKRLAILNHAAGGANEFVASPAAPNAKARRKYPKVLPRYRNPETSETWSGRGKRPRWMVVALEAGRGMEEFRINGPDREGRGRRRRSARPADGPL